jgi:hypothetical protein
MITKVPILRTVVTHLLQVVSKQSRIGPSHKKRFARVPGGPIGVGSGAVNIPLETNIVEAGHGKNLVG